MDPHAGIDDAVPAHHDIRVDLNILGDLGGFVYHGTWVDSRLDRGLRVECPQRHSVSKVSVLGSQNCNVFAVDRGAFVEKDRRGLRGSDLGRVFGVREEGYVARAGEVEAGGGGNFQVGSPDFNG